jgi:hypothetical protein
VIAVILQNDRMKRKLSHDFKLVARTAPEMYEMFNHLVLRAAAGGLKFRERKVGVEAALNAVLVDFFSRPEAERMKVIEAGVPAFEAIMERPAPDHWPIIPPLADPPRLQTAQNEPPSPPRKRRKSG